MIKAILVVLIAKESALSFKDDIKMGIMARIA
jgi:hypothetical protein